MRLAELLPAASGRDVSLPFWWPFEWQSSKPADLGKLRAAILGRIELLLRKGRRQAQPFELPGRETPLNSS